MKKIIESNFIDFRNPLKIVSTDKYFVIQPDYQIQGQRVYRFGNFTRSNQRKGKMDQSNSR